MVGGKSDARFGTRDFGFQHKDARVQLIDRKRVQIFPLQFPQRVAFAPWQILVKIHIRVVDPLSHTVNKGN